MELVLLSAAFDAGPARRRVLVGRRDRVLGRRSLDPVRLGIAGGVVALLLIVAVWAMWPSSRPSAEDSARAAAMAASAASAAEMAEAASAASAAAAARAAAAAPVPASEASDAASPASAASEAQPAASAATAASAVDGAASTPVRLGVIPNLRPSLHSGIERKQEQDKKASDKHEPDKKDGAKDDKPADAAKSAASAPVSEAERRLSVDDAGLSNLMKRGAAPGGKLVALVTLPQKNKADAQAQLVRMREMIAQTTGGSAAANGEVFQTKEGWRAAVWPFGSREEAQLINATLLARGMRARAVDF